MGRIFSQLLSIKSISAQSIISNDMKRSLIFLILLGVCGLQAEKINSESMEPQGQEQWESALEALRSEVPEFALIDGSFSSGKLKMWQLDKSRRRLTVRLMLRSLSDTVSR